ARLRHRLTLAMRIGLAPRLPREVVLFVAEPVPSGRSGPATVPPLGLRRQTVFQALLCPHPAAECDRIAPRHEHNRMIVGLLPARFVPATIFYPIAPLVHVLPILADRDVRGSHEKWLGDVHFMHRTFAVDAIPGPSCIISLVTCLIQLEAAVD